MKSIQLSLPEGPINATVNLPASKSISNRALIIQALCDGVVNLHNLSNAEDTVLLQKAITESNKGNTVYAGIGGTTFRFLLAYLYNKPGKWLLSGDREILERPHFILMNALEEMGGRPITPTEKGFEFEGKKIFGGKIKIPANVSSQYISALMLVAPVIENITEIKLTSQPVSNSYIGLTEDVMAEFGATILRAENSIIILNNGYTASDLTIENDWTNASYFYALAALRPGSELLLPGLKEISSQGDAILVELMKDFGVKTVFTKEGARISSSGATINSFEFDFVDHPDLVQTFVVLCANLGINAVCKGIQTLRVKETDRIEALKNELEPLGYKITASETELRLSGIRNANPLKPFKTYNDHRMAMSLALFATKEKLVTINDPEVVNKSFPQYWEEMKGSGTLLHS